MDYIIIKDDFINSLREQNDLCINERIKKLEEFNNIVLCPYRGHKIDLRILREYQIRTEEYKCPECDEWISWNRNLPWFQQTPYPINSFMIHHPEKYKCIVNSKFEDPNYIPDIDELRTWFDKNLNPIRPNTIPLNPGEKSISLSETTYVAVKE